MGYFKDQAPTLKDWVNSRLNWIDLYCSYTPYREVKKIVEKNYFLTHCEMDYCLFRAQSKPLIRKLLAIKPLTGIYQRLFRRLAFMVLRLEKRPEASLNLTKKNTVAHAVTQQKTTEITYATPHLP